jgi:magnesium transporter
MTTQYAAVNEDARVRDAFEALRGDEHLLKTLTHVFLIDKQQRLVGAVALGRLLAAPKDRPLKELAFEETLKVHVDDDRDRVVEIFDKYNLLALPVVDEENELCGVITADDVISVLTPDD